MRNATTRFFRQYRVIRDSKGNEVAYAIVGSDDKRTPRAPECGADAGFLVRHEGRNRARRRELSREYGLTGTIAASNRPYVKPRV